MDRDKMSNLYKGPSIDAFYQVSVQFRSIHSPPFYAYLTSVAPGTVGTVPTVPLFLAGTANRTTIWTENNNFEMKKGYSLLFTLRTNKQEIIYMCNIMYVSKRLWQFHLGNTSTAGVKCQLLISFYI
jgi:hypothetical protein